jgi:hypothetical protein
MPFYQRMLASTAPKATFLIRLLVGLVFLSEGIQKFLFPASLGAGRFLKIGIPTPQVIAPFVGAIEILCGSLQLIGLTEPTGDCSASISDFGRYRFYLIYLTKNFADRGANGPNVIYLECLGRTGLSQAPSQAHRECA